MPSPNPTIIPIMSAPQSTSSQYPSMGGMMYRSTSLDEGKNKIENEKLSALEEHLRAIEGLNMYGSVDVLILWLVPDVGVPRNSRFQNLKNTVPLT